MRSDESLALAAQEGDKTAAEELLRRYKNTVRGVARSFFLAGGDAEDPRAGGNDRAVPRRHRL